MHELLCEVQHVDLFNLCVNNPSHLARRPGSQCQKPWISADRPRMSRLHPNRDQFLPVLDHIVWFLDGRFYGFAFLPPFTCDVVSQVLDLWRNGTQKPYNIGYFWQKLTPIWMKPRNMAARVSTLAYGRHLDILLIINSLRETTSPNRKPRNLRNERQILQAFAGQKAYRCVLTYSSVAGASPS